MILAVLQAGPTGPAPELLMTPVCGEPMIVRQLERVRRARTLTRVVVALDRASANEPVARHLAARGQAVFRGFGSDPLNLAAQAVRQHTAGRECSHVVRVSADGPLTDPEVIDEAVRLALNSRAAWTGNTERRTYPLGLEVEVVTADLLFAAAREAAASAGGKALAAFLRRRPERHGRAHLTRPGDLSSLRWVVRNSEDLAFVRRVYETLHPADPAFTSQDVLDLLDRRPELAAAA